MQPVLEPGSIEKPLTFDIGLIYTTRLSYQCVHLIPILQSNCAEGLHFSAFHHKCIEKLFHGNMQKYLYIINTCHDVFITVVVNSLAL